uniref:Uncharacterized protein n=1 Tax=Athene cunicularia TaxID=194338 RepID=A0A663N456_ATHCN
PHSTLEISRKRGTEKGNYLYFKKLICCHQGLSTDTKNLIYPRLVLTKQTVLSFLLKWQVPGFSFKGMRAY